MKTPLVIEQGKTFKRILRWGTLPFVYKPISAISNAAPASITAAGHGVPDGWQVAVVSAKGMRQINSEVGDDGAPLTLHKATVVDVNTLTLNDVNSSDFNAYTGSAVLQYYTPVDLTGFTARMTIKDRIGGAVLDTLTTVNGKIVIDNTAKTITLLIDAVTTAAYTWTTGVYDLELVSAGGEVTALLEGSVTVQPEVTT